MTAGGYAATHHLVDRYLGDLARMLDHLDPAARADVLAGVREHVDASLADLDRQPTDADVRRVLDDLGPAEDVAAAAYEDVSATRPDPSPVAPSPVAPPAGRPEQVPVLARGWVPLVVTLALTAVAGLVTVLLLGAPAEGFAALMVLPILLTVPIAIVVVASPLWRGWATALAVWAPFILPVGVFFGAPVVGRAATPWFFVALGARSVQDVSPVGAGRVPGRCRTCPRSASPPPSWPHTPPGRARRSPPGSR